jgi:hypothetical protein
VQQEGIVSELCPEIYVLSYNQSQNENLDIRVLLKSETRIYLQENGKR